MTIRASIATGASEDEIQRFVNKQESADKKSESAESIERIATIRQGGCGCEYCNAGADTRIDMHFVTLEKDHVKSGKMIRGIKYCPMCGRTL